MDIALPPHITGAASTTVTQANTAQAVGSGSVPVYATPALVALLEQAAVDALASHLPPGMTTVGVRIDVQHLAATPVGMDVRARATLRAQDGRKLHFDVIAHDGIEQIAQGSHERVLVDQERFMARVTAKAGL
jgi:predicted thioesterase